MVVETSDGGQHAFEFGPNSLFAPPLNTRYRIVNVARHAPVRLACVNDLRILMNLFHDDAFFFDNPFAFPERQGNPEPAGRQLDRRACLRNTGRHLSKGASQRREASHHLHSRCRLYAALACGRPRLPTRRLATRPVLRAAGKHDPSALQHRRPTRALSHRWLRHHALSDRVRAPARRGKVRTAHRPTPADQDPRIHALWLEELRKTGVRSEMTHGLPLHSRLA